MPDRPAHWTRAPRREDFPHSPAYYEALYEYEEALTREAERDRRIPTRGTLFPAEEFVPIRFDDILKGGRDE